MSHAGSRLLADLADRTTLTGELTEALAGLRRPRAVHDPGRVLVDLAVAVADGAECISDIAVLADQAGAVRAGGVGLDGAGGCWTGSTTPQLAAVAAARAAAREVVWAQRAEVTGARGARRRRRPGVELPGLVLDVDATIVVCHSEKEQAAATFKHTFGYHPMLAFCDNTGEFLAGLLRPGNAGANTAADHITVLDPALAQIPDAAPARHPILVRADGAGCSKAFLAHIRGLRDAGREQRVLRRLGGHRPGARRDRRAPERAWTDAIDADGRHRDGAGRRRADRHAARRDLADYPPGTRVIVRRERPHPGAQLDAFEERDGWRYTVLRHRHPRRAAGVPGRPPPRPRPGRGPHPLRQGHRPRPLPVPHVRDQRRLADLVMLAVDLLAWTQTCSCTASWPRPNRRRCATGCCTSPPASSAAAPASGSASSAPGPGRTTSPPPSPGCAALPVPAG